MHLGSWNISFGVVGATGVVGKELINLLLDKGVPPERLMLMASPTSVGKILTVKDTPCHIHPITFESLKACPLIFFCAGSDISKQWAKRATQAGCYVIDQSSAFRLEKGVPLVIPEINRATIPNTPCLIASPNCSTTIALMALAPLHRQFELERFFAATYQSVSGAGAKGLSAYQASLACPQTEETGCFSHPILGNVIPKIGTCTVGQDSQEEKKMVAESRKILNLPHLKIGTTCVRVPVERTHSIAIHAGFKQPVSLELARNALEAFEGIRLYDAPEDNLYPVPTIATQHTDCWVGRLRLDNLWEKGLAMFVCGDQLWKGAGLNAVQIAEHLACRHKD